MPREVRATRCMAGYYQCEDHGTQSFWAIGKEMKAQRMGGPTSRPSTRQGPGTLLLTVATLTGHSGS